MTKRALELIPELVLGSLSEGERREVEAAIAASPGLAAEVSAAADALNALPSALDPIPPSPHVRARILQSIGGVERLSPFALQLSRYFDLALDRVQELLRAIDDVRTTWEAGPMPGIHLMHFGGGPKTAAADVGFVKLPRGLHFPWHRHRGREVNFVLEGQIRDFDGKIYGPGQAIEKEAGTEHEFFVGDDRDALLAVVIFEGFDILGYRPK